MDALVRLVSGASRNRPPVAPRLVAMGRVSRDAGCTAAKRRAADAIQIAAVPLTDRVTSVPP